MYRILHENAEVVEHRNQRHDPVYDKLHVLATVPNQDYTWDIAKLPGPLAGLFFYLHVVPDLFSRFVVGWLIASRESAALAEQNIAESCDRQSIAPGQLTIHSDRGGPMTAKSLTLLDTDLGITPGLARPRRPDDTPNLRSTVQDGQEPSDFPRKVWKFGGRARRQRLFH